jgi:cell wall-associated NlpC family hydrolase
MVDIAVDGATPPPTAAQIRDALASNRLALAPKVRKRLRGGQVSGPTVAALLAAAHPGSQLLVHAVSAKRAQVQATSLADTRLLIAALRAMPASSITVELHPVRPDFADEAQPRSAARASDVARRVVAAALSQVGVPYSWGGGNANGPTTGTCHGYRGSIRPCPASRTVGLDCSGLTLFAYAQAGITLDHYAAFQWLEGRRIDVAELMPGDLVFFNPKGDGPGHVGMYVGNGSFVHAPHTGDVVKVSPLAAYARSYMGAVRPR